MRIESVTLRDFRGVVDTTVEFGDGVTVVEGPNEVGKSSLVEAVRLLRQFKATSKASDVRAVEPIGVDAGPEVRMTLRTGRYHLTYRKRWMKSPVAELQVDAPAPEQLTGDEAHDRFLRILRDTVDVDLLEALEVEQGRSLDQPQLASVQALRRALDASDGGAAADGGTAADGHDALMERIEQEYLRHWTAKGGKATGEFRAAGARVDELEEALTGLESSSAVLDQKVQEYERQSGLLARLTDQLEENAAQLDRLRAREGEVRALRTAAESSGRAREDARRELDTAVAALDARTGMVAELRERATAIEQLAAELGRSEEAHARADAALREAVGRSGRAEEALKGARAAAKGSAAAVARLRDRLELADLDDRVLRVAQAQERIVEAEAALVPPLVDQEVVRHLTSLETAVKVAEGAREAAAARMVVRVLGDAPVEVDGVAVDGDGADGSRSRELRVLRPVRVEVRGVVSVDVEPATPSKDLETASARAASALDAALTAAGSGSVEEAQEAADRQSQALEKRSRARDDLARALGGATPEELRGHRAAVAARLCGDGEAAEDAGQERVSAGGDGALGATASDLDELMAAHDLAEAAESEAAGEADRARLAVEALRDDADEARDAHTRVVAGHEAAVREHARGAERVAREREQTPDEALEAAVGRARALLEKRAVRADADEQALRVADPDTLDLDLGNTTKLQASLARDREGARQDADRLKGSIDQLAADGLYDRIEDTRAELAQVRASWERLDRSARAVRLLREVMTRHRDEARTRYVAPFRQRIEELGSLVFGPGFQVGVGQDLTIESRTVDGRTVPFASLSAGAREQLALLGRLACARIIDAAEGAPVVLDDTLGFADPERLRMLNAVLGRVGDTAQVIVLTCQPERFSRIGGASHVRLAPPPRPSRA